MKPSLLSGLLSQLHLSVLLVCSFLHPHKLTHHPSIPR